MFFDQPCRRTEHFVGFALKCERIWPLLSSEIQVKSSKFSRPYRPKLLRNMGGGSYGRREGVLLLTPLLESEEAELESQLNEFWVGYCDCRLTEPWLGSFTIIKSVVYFWNWIFWVKKSKVNFQVCVQKSVPKNIFSRGKRLESDAMAKFWRICPKVET